MSEQPSLPHYQALTRRYRPQTFHQVRDQKAIVTTLKHAIALQRVSHAYLFCGSRGVGKTTLARIFAKALNCKNLSEDFEPCNRCSSCQEITSCQSLDVLEIDGASNRGIDDIRELNETALYSPSHGSYKIYIIDEVHMLTKEAFNALLKTLEEPPDKVKFFFATTEPHKIPATIISRCQRFDLRRISLQSMCEQLRAIAEELSITLEEEALYALAKSADGSLRDAESLLDQMLCTNHSVITFDHVAEILGLSSHEALFTLDTAFHTQDIHLGLQLATTLYEEGKNLPHFLEMLTEHYQLLLKHHLGAPLFHSLPAHYKESYQKAASIYTKEQCLYILEYLLEWLEKFSKLPCQHIHLELILLHIIRSKQRIFLDDLVKELKALQHPPSTATIEKPQVLEPSLTEAIHSPQEPTSSPPAQEQKATELNSQKHETLLRFAAIELNGTLKKPEASSH